MKMKSVAVVVCLVFVVVFVGSAFAAPIVKHNTHSTTAPAKTKAVTSRASSTVKAPVATAKHHPRHSHKTAPKTSQHAAKTAAHKAVKTVTKTPAKCASTATRHPVTKTHTGGAKPTAQCPHKTK